MSRPQPLDPDQAPAKSRALLDGILSQNGQAGPMVRTMAHSPALLQGYLDLSRAMKRVKLPRSLSERISLAVQQWIGCALCLDAHTRGARAAGATDAEIDLARQGTASDAREAALIAFALAVLVEPGSVGDDDLARLKEHGWSDRVIGDVVGLVALNLMTGGFNLVAGLEPAAPDPGE